MKNLLQKFSSLRNATVGLSDRSGENRVLLFDSCEAAYNVAFMLDGQWDECNSAVIPSSDEIAIKTAASLVEARWCDSGKSCTLLPKLSVEILKRRYAVGDRHFINANLMCADLSHLNLSQINFGWAKLRGANLSGADLSGADLTAADLSDANLSGADLSSANLLRADLTGANTSDTNLCGACLRGAIAQIRGDRIS
ncbi:pentapeptide repeat-containing protein [Chroococcidiopsis sp [FACHB-1243]]|uniref:pentapeptide repeat-containing protein n=1 Tax=Chroococcidiopsis sp. [FACHB-1243] TaxID=2692781 RepID=UPI0018F0191C|nr:pentapeptide repeat-containing protein [Chroococcidiopsis sp. [FACHB-1243]]